MVHGYAAKRFAPDYRFDLARRVSVSRLPHFLPRSIDHEPRLGTSCNLSGEGEAFVEGHPSL
jgi:hypothetical protein